MGSKRREQVQKVLERETVRSALVLRRILGPIHLTPIMPQDDRPDLQAEPPSSPGPGQRPGGRFDFIKMVEAVGIEPTAGNPQQKASTSIAGSLVLSPPFPPTGWLSGRPAPKDLAPYPRAGLGASHRNMTSKPGPR